MVCRVHFTYVILFTAYGMWLLDQHYKVSCLHSCLHQHSLTLGMPPHMHVLGQQDSTMWGSDYTSVKLQMHTHVWK